MPLVYKKKLIGALTSKPFAFTARSWEVVMVPSVDTYDSFLGSVRLDFRNNDLLRILPLINEGLNEEWLTDKARFSYDGLKRQRFLKPYVRLFGPYNNTDLGSESYFRSLVGFEQRQNLRPSSKEEVSSTLSSATCALGVKCASVFFGKEVDLETALISKLVLEGQFKKVVYKNGDYSNFSCFDPDLLRFTVNANQLLGVSSLVLVGSNLRWELPLFNVKIMRRVLSSAVTIFTVAVRSVFNYPTLNLSSNAQLFITSFLKGRSKFMLKIHDPFILLSYNLAKYAPALASVYPVMAGVVFPWASTATLLEVCPSKPFSEVRSEPVLSLSINSDAMDLSDRGPSVGLLSHGHFGHNALDFVFPCAAYSESTAHFFNIFRTERYSRFGYALSKEILPSWAALAKLFRPTADRALALAASLSRVCFSSTVSKPFESELPDHYASFYLNTLPMTIFSNLAKTPFYEVTPNYYRTHYVSRNSKPTSLASARFSFALSNFLIR